MLVDVHAHLTEKVFSDKLDAILKNATNHKVSVIINNGMNVESNRDTLVLAKKYSMIKPALGIHPIDSLTMGDVEEEIDFISKQKIVAVGETGLDLYHTDKLDKQTLVFERLINVAEKKNIPLIIHSRKAESQVFEMLTSSRAKKVILHCFTGKKRFFKLGEDYGYYFSIPPVIVRSTHFQTLVNNISLSSLLTETDCPYQSPFKDVINEPAYVSETIKMIAQLKKVTIEETEKLIFMNFQKLFASML